MADQGTVKLGPWGGPGGAAWHKNPGVDTAIKEIVICHGSVVNSITFKSIVPTSGNIVPSVTHSGIGGQCDMISIDVPGEYLTLISGTINYYLGHAVIESLTFYTNERTHGPYGPTNGSRFEIPMENGEIIGFFGNTSATLVEKHILVAIGIYVKPHAN
ncbi:hypothetical protein ACOSQ3_032488 [Xanthoceras sorbifolium]